MRSGNDTVGGGGGGGVTKRLCKMQDFQLTQDYVELVVASPIREFK